MYHKAAQTQRARYSGHRRHAAWYSYEGWLNLPMVKQKGRSFALDPFRGYLTLCDKYPSRMPNAIVTSNRSQHRPFSVPICGSLFVACIGHPRKPFHAPSATHATDESLICELAPSSARLPYLDTSPILIPD